MKRENRKKLRLNLETLRDLDLRRASGGAEGFFITDIEGTLADGTPLPASASGLAC